MQCKICSEIKTKNVKTNCGHECCKECFAGLFKSDPTFPMECFLCHAILTDKECLKYLPPEEYIKFKKSKKFVRSQMDKNLFMCRNKNCDGEFRHQKPGSFTKFVCTKCHETNCLNCNAVHKSNETCEKWMARNPDIIERRLKNKLENDTKIEAKNGMYCVRCGVFCERIGGCYGIKCPQCKTALCFITQKARWGPKGFRDISGGCQCTENKRCHEDCIGCDNDIDRSSTEVYVDDYDDYDDYDYDDDDDDDDFYVNYYDDDDYVNYDDDDDDEHEQELYNNESMSHDQEYLDCLTNMASEDESDFHSAHEA